MAPTAPSLGALLRAGTRDLHERSEAAFVLGAPDLTRAEYVAVLARLLAFYDGAERALVPWTASVLPYGVDLAARAKAPLLRRDLQALGTAPLDATPMIAADPPFTHPRSVASALGVAYVLEGATLGGQLLRRRLGPALGLHTDTGLAFFGAYGAAVGTMWRGFSDTLDRFDAALDPAARPAAHADALTGARATFLAFERYVVVPTARPTPERLA